MDTLQPIPGTPLVASLARYSEHATGAFSRNTERALRSDLALFAAWCAQHGVESCPAAPSTVAAFLDATAASRKPSTLRRYLASIAHLHRAAGLQQSPTTSVEVQLRMRAIARSAAQQAREAAVPLQDQAEGITQRDVERILVHVGTTLRDLRDVALLLVGRDLLARRSELVALKVGDVVGNNDGSGVATIRLSKTDHAGEGAECYLAPETMAAVRRWLEAATITAGPLFRALRKSAHVTDRAIAAGEVSAILKRLAQRAKLDPGRTARVSGHSLRVGMTQDLVASGADLPGVMQAGRWSTAAMPAAYARKLLARRGAVALYHAGRRP